MGVHVNIWFHIAWATLKTVGKTMFGDNEQGKAFRFGTKLS